MNTASPGSIELGDEVRDSITPFTGVAIAITTWLNGCRRVSVQPRDLEEKGRLAPTETFDETQLIILNKHVVDSPNRAAAASGATKGGPRPEPVRYADPGREDRRR